METPDIHIETETETETEKENNIFINESLLEFGNINYIVKIGKSLKRELILYIKEENIISSGYYQNYFTLQKLKKINNYFKTFDTIDKIIEIFKDILCNKNLIITKINDDLSILFIINKNRNNKEEVNIKLKKRYLETQEILDILISHINNINLEINALKNEKKNLKEENKKLIKKVDDFLKGNKSIEDIDENKKEKPKMVSEKQILEQESEKNNKTDNEIIKDKEKEKEGNKKENKEEKKEIQSGEEIIKKDDMNNKNDIKEEKKI